MLSVFLSAVMQGDISPNVVVPKLNVKLHAMLSLMLSIITLNVVNLSGIVLSVIKASGIMLSVISLS